MCAGMAGREAEVQRLVLVLAVTATMLCCGSATRAQALYPAEFAACQPLPPWYPRDWELMGALSMRHLCLWTCLLSASLLPLSCSLSAPARVRSRCTAGSSPAISASRLVVVKMRSKGFVRFALLAAIRGR